MLPTKDSNFSMIFTEQVTTNITFRVSQFSKRILGESELLLCTITTGTIINRRLHIKNEQCLNLMNLSRARLKFILNPPKDLFQLSAGLNLEKCNTILSRANNI